jgi:hypothetical protein
VGRIDGMADAAHPLLALLSERAALLEALLERHPAWHLLAEYASELHDRPPTTAELIRDPAVLHYGQGLLHRMEHAILDLESIILPMTGSAWIEP